MAETKNGYRGMRVTVMGLGLHGGGLESARYLARRGARVTVTDLQDAEALAPSLEQLKGLGETAYPIRYTLGRHEPGDFQNAGMVIKNPGVKSDSPFLRLCGRIETDISLFLAENPARLCAVTGSKGKSATSSAIHWALRLARERGLLPGAAYIGGNITVSPLTFVDTLGKDDDAVLELSSWQLGDLAGRGFKPRCAVLTAIMPDHLDRYGGMDAYVADKRIIYQSQDQGDATIASLDDGWGGGFLAETPGRPLAYSARPLPAGTAGAWLGPPGEPGFARLAGGEMGEVLPPQLLVPGFHQRRNLLAAALALLDLGLSAAFVREALGNFPGIEHRLEFFHEAGGVRFYNDSAATIPHAAAAAVAAFSPPPVLVAGGADKNLDLSPLAAAAGQAKALSLLAGEASERLRPLLDAAGVSYRGPFDVLDEAVMAALDAAEPGDRVVLSPGCASFGMFLNEFDRGCRWKEAVRRLAKR